jgi:hypothetical protein
MRLINSAISRQSHSLHVWAFSVFWLVHKVSLRTSPTGQCSEVSRGSPDPRHLPFLSTRTIPRNFISSAAATMSAVVVLAQRLPIEITGIIFQNTCSTYVDVQMLPARRLVCKSWHVAADSTPALWSSVSVIGRRPRPRDYTSFRYFSNTKHFVSPPRANRVGVVAVSAIPTLFKHGRGTAKQLIIDAILKRFDIKALNKTLHSCKSELRSLELWIGQRNSCRSRFDGWCIGQVLHHLAELPALKTLRIPDGEYHITLPGFLSYKSFRFAVPCSTPISTILRFLPHSRPPQDNWLLFDSAANLHVPYSLLTNETSQHCANCTSAATTSRCLSPL